MNKEEHKIQVQICHYLEARNVCYFAVPNGAKRNPQTASYYKAEGLKAGVSDLVIVLKNKVLFIEVKQKGKKQTETQIEFETKVTTLKHSYYVVYSIDDVHNILKKENV